jgi:hypothetical protein
MRNDDVGMNTLFRLLLTPSSTNLLEIQTTFLRRSL